MEDIFLSIVAKLAEYTVGPILHHARYLCCFNNFAGILPNAKEELELTRNSVKERVEEAIKRTEIIKPAVEKWLKDVEKVLEEVHMLEGEISDVSKSYFRSQCQYFLTKKIARKIEKMTQLNHDSKFEPFSKIAELPGMKYYSSKDFVLFKSTESIYKKLLEALKDKSVCTIGLVGLGGSGKTTLAKEVGKKAEELKLFEKVVMATVSQTPNIRSIQMQIAEKLGFEYKEETEEGRAQRLSERLRRGTTLLILDDVWEKLEFEAIGIPYNENNKGCGVLLTTRNREVCISMQCQTIIELNLLTGEEAWTLFTLYANITDDSQDALKVVARKIVNECKGLPIAIVTVGSTLRGKTFDEWESALSRLEDSEPLDIPKGLTSPYACLQLSYDNLTNQLAKSLLLLCSIFPEDHEIDLEDLFRFGRGLDQTRTLRTMEKARMEMRVAVNILRDSCLLLHTNNKERVKMHDMVRDVALWIASERGQAILASTGMDPRMLVDDEAVKYKRVISLWDLKNGKLLDDDQLNCPSLEILLFHSPEVDFEVSNACFERLKMIKILAFLTSSYEWWWPSATCTLSLPQSIESLKNLGTLCLRGYKLGDISILESLQALEILDLRGSSFKELPNGIASLKKLKLLDLFDCLIQEKNAYEVIGRCLQLNDLYLYIHSYGYPEFLHNVSFSRLQRYVLIFKMDNSYVRTQMLDEHRPTRALCIDGFNASVQSFISLPIKGFFQKAEYLYLMHLKGGYKNVIPSMDPQGMNQLKLLDLEDCPEIECLFDSSYVDLLQTEDAFSSLVILSLYFLDNLQEVFRDPSSRCSLKNLEELSIFYCRQLYNISFPMNSKLCHLKVLRISNCPMLTCIFKPSIVQTLELLEQVEIYHCYELKQIIYHCYDYVSSQSHTSFMLPKLRKLHIEGCYRLEYIFPVCFAAGLVSLEELEIRFCNELKQIIEEVEEGSVDYVSSQSHTSFMLPKLRTLNIHWCHRLEYIFPMCFAAGLISLEELCIESCSELKQIIEEVEEGSVDYVSSQSHTSFMLPKLRILRIYGCHSLEYIFPVCFAAALVSLEELYIEYCDELKQIIEEVEEGSVDYVSSQSHTSFMLPKLRTITIARCHSLEYIFPVCFAAGLVSLEELEIIDCRELKQIIKEVEEGSVDYVSSQSHTSFMLPKLRTLDIFGCERLEYIFPVAGLVSLEELKIGGCNALKYDILFLSDLQQDSTATEKELLCLVTTTFNQLSDHVLSSKLRKLHLIGLGVKGVFQFQIREHGSNRELAAPLNLDLTHAQFWDLPELEFIWKGPSNFLSLHMLNWIRVYGCPKLKTIFSLTIFRSLPMLNKLSINNCEELEQIFDSGDAKSLYTCSEQVCFPNLKYIWVQKCNKLKYLFHNFVAGHFNNLTNLTIEGCSHLQKVFSFECEIDDDGQEGIVKDGEKVLLHNLHSITLTSLPNFKEIHHGFKLKEDVDHDICDCPKYSPSLYLHTE